MPDSGAGIAICAPRIFDGRQFLHQHCVLLRGGQIDAVRPRAELDGDVQLLELESGTLAPGFVDLQVNGGGDVLFNAAPEQASLLRILEAHRTKGTTALLPTVLSDTAEVRQAAVAAVVAARAAGFNSVLGIHLEGPFFNPVKRGAHREEHVRPLTTEDVDWLCSLDDLRVMLTLAPEQLTEQKLRQLIAGDVIVCAGHTDASYETVAAVAGWGLSGVTHLFNAMSPLQGRSPGTVGAALDIDGLWAGIIADGYHVHPAAIRLAQRAKAPGKLVFVSDAMATVGGDNPSFELYGERIVEKDGALINTEGKLAGSAIGMIDAVRYGAETVGLPLEECLRMASAYPAAIMGLSAEIGSLAAGSRADLVHFDEDFVVNHTWVGGEIARHSHNH